MPTKTKPKAKAKAAPTPAAKKPLTKFQKTQYKNAKKRNAEQRSRGRAVTSLTRPKPSRKLSASSPAVQKIANDIDPKNFPLPEAEPPYEPVSVTISKDIFDVLRNDFISQLKEERKAMSPEVAKLDQQGDKVLFASIDRFIDESRKFGRAHPVVSTVMLRAGVGVRLAGPVPQDIAIFDIEVTEDANNFSGGMPITGGGQKPDGPKSPSVNVFGIT